MVKVPARRGVHEPPAPERPVARSAPLHRRPKRSWQRPVAGAVLAGAVAVGVGGALVAWHPWRSAAVPAAPSPAPNDRLGQVFSGHQLLGGMPYVLPTPTVDYLYTDSIFGPPYVPVRTFRVLGRWLHERDAMPHPPPWVDIYEADPSGPLWAPAVVKVGHHYVMWFTAPWADPHPTDGIDYPKCVGWATARSPLGPFTNRRATRPALCQLADHGTIDALPVRIKGRWWLYFKSDDNADDRSRHTKIWVQRLAANATTLVGHPTLLYENHLDWEGQMVEAPTMVVHGGHYYLFYSGNSSWVPEAGIGLATCAGPAGPCRSPYNGPWLGSNPLGQGPDEVRAFTQDDNTWLLYTPEATYYKGELGQLAVSRVAFGRHGPYVASFGPARPGP